MVDDEDSPADLEATSLGIPFMLTRLGLSILGILAIAAVTQKSLHAEQQGEVYALNQA